jgi:hypothetical protein
MRPCRELGDAETYLGICGLLFLVALLVGGGLGLVWSALLVAEGLPLLTEELADLTCRGVLVKLDAFFTAYMARDSLPNLMPGLSSRTFSRCSLAKNM